MQRSISSAANREIMSRTCSMGASFSLPENCCAKFKMYRLFHVTTLNSAANLSNAAVATRAGTPNGNAISALGLRLSTEECRHASKAPLLPGSALGTNCMWRSSTGRGASGDSVLAPGWNAACRLLGRCCTCSLHLRHASERTPGIEVPLLREPVHRIGIARYAGFDAGPERLRTNRVAGSYLVAHHRRARAVRYHVGDHSHAPLMQRFSCLRANGDVCRLHHQGRTDERSIVSVNEIRSGCQDEYVRGLHQKFVAIGNDATNGKLLLDQDSALVLRLHQGVDLEPVGIEHRFEMVAHADDFRSRSVQVPCRPRSGGDRPLASTGH